ncbi:uncharacterized protein LOC126972953 isoform X2 [Leptidea sinapis]|uniref:uncharacterized protein LOC126972953 isoform X2 n=1 Tax=Leptidea sinapis TaxID=189913 RepID=UPI002146CF26|nr:uncharacterized protein LOC126972953 isoform X2 [Leptidea sinapis]
MRARSASIMFRLLVWWCFIGFTINYIAAFEGDDKHQDDFYQDFSLPELKNIPVYIDSKGTVRDFDPKDRGNKETESEEKFKETVKKDISDTLHYDDIKNYQFEDNRSEEEISEGFNKKDNENEDFQLLKGDDDLAPPDDEKSLEDFMKDYISSQFPSENEILEETRSILNEDVNNDFKDIAILESNSSLPSNIYGETTKILSETTNKFDDLNEPITDKMDPKQFEEFMADLEELDSVRSKLGDQVDKTLEETNDYTSDEFDYYKSNEQNDYNMIEDDYEDMKELFPNKDTENKELLKEEHKENGELVTVLYLNDALFANSNDVMSESATTDYVNENDTKISTPTTEATTEVKSVEPKGSLAMPDIDEMNDTDLDDFFAKYFEQRNADVTPTNTIQISLNVNETTIVTSPNYPNNYPTGEITDYIITGDGVGIEMNVTDFSVNGFIGDYLLVLPGRTDDKGSDGILFSYGLKTERKLRYTDVDRMFMRFEANQGMAFQRGFSIGLKMISPRTDVVDDIAEPEAAEFPRSNATLSINIGGIALSPFITIKEEFTRILADMATMYINAKGIDAGISDTHNVTELRGEALCFHNWPGSENCVEVTFWIPLVYDEEVEEPRLHSDDLKEMWNTYASQDPFAARLAALGVEEFTFPDERMVMTAWMAIAAGVLIFMALLALALWRFSCFQEYTMMPSFSDTDSLNEKRNLDLYPTPHQTLPSLYSEPEVKWPDSKFDAQDGVGFSNKSYKHDHAYDVDSEDEFRTIDRRYTTDV